MKSKTSLLLLVGILTVNIVSGAIQTASAADTAIPQFKAQGIISSFDQKTKVLVIGENTYSVDGSTKVYSGSGKSLPVTTLKAGLPIMYTVDALRTTTIKELMVLPTN